MTVFKTLVATIVLAGCASSPLPPANFTEAQSAISAADAIGAEHEPRAALHLKMARDQLTEAQSLARDGDDEEAALVLSRAKVDAEVALMVTREVTAKREADKATQELKSLSN
jgi:hypothetical protein